MPAGDSGRVQGDRAEGASLLRRRGREYAAGSQENSSCRFHGSSRLFRSGRSNSSSCSGWTFGGLILYQTPRGGWPFSLEYSFNIARLAGGTSGSQSSSVVNKSRCPVLIIIDLSAL